MEYVFSDIAGQQLAAAYRCHGEPIHPQHTYSSGDGGDSEKIPMSSFQGLGGHRRFSNADVIIHGSGGGGGDGGGDKLAMTPFQELGGHRRFSNAEVIILGSDRDGDGGGGGGGGDKLGHRRFSNADVIILGSDRDGDGGGGGEVIILGSDRDGDGGGGGDKLGHRRFSNADVIILGSDRDGDGGGGDVIHRDCSYTNTEPRSPSTDGDDLRTGSVAGAFNHYPYTLAIESVWRDNCEEVFQGVIHELRQHPGHLYIALDLEFVAGASTDVHLKQFCLNTWYHHLRTLVSGGDMLQMGLAFAFDDQHDGGAGAQDPPSMTALEINLKFDVGGAREYNHEPINFLTNQGHCLTDHKDRGVTTEQLLNGLLCHIPFGHESVTWVTFHGDNDFGFLLRLLQEHQQGRRGVLPPDRAGFMRLVRQVFPLFYDVRVLGQLEEEGFTGGLKDLAELLGVRRIGGEHHAGSDALLALSCFKEIHRRNEHAPHGMDSRQCLLSGMEELDMAIKCARHIDDASVTAVEVRGHNFYDQARLINELVTSNFKIVGVDVQLPPLGWPIPFHSGDDLKQDYDLIKIRLEGIETFQVTIGFMNPEGMLAYGRLWRFHISSKANVAGGNDAYVRPGQLAWLLASCGATHNHNVAWVTYQGSHEIACFIKSFLAAGDLPIDWCSYMEHQRGVFPNLNDVGLIAQECPDIGKQTLGLMMLPAPQALLVLRCYKRLAGSPLFPRIAEALRGQLMASWSCFWY